MPYNNFSDEHLFSLLKEGNHKAFTELYKRYSGILYSHVLKRLNDPEEAIDIIQDLFTTLWKKKEEIEISSYLSGYLYTAVRNQVINRIARKEITTEYFNSQLTNVQITLGSTDHLIREKQLRELIEREIESLPPRMREVFQLSRFHYLTHKEIGVKLDVSEQTVKKQVNKALRILRIKLGIYSILICVFL